MALASLTALRAEDGGRVRRRIEHLEVVGRPALSAFNRLLEQHAHKSGARSWEFYAHSAFDCTASELTRFRHGQKRLPRRAEERLLAEHPEWKVPFGRVLAEFELEALAPPRFEGPSPPGRD